MGPVAAAHGVPPSPSDTLAELWLILGTDAARDMSRWREPERVFALCKIAAVPRGGANEGGGDDEDAIPRGIRVLRDAPRSATSSTEIRAAVAAGLPIEGGVPPPVAEYIRKHGLYLDGRDGV